MASIDMKKSIEELLFIAAEDGNLVLAEAMIQIGADVNTKDSKGWTPLMKASSNGNLEIAKVLTKTVGADIDAKTPGGWTALMIAAKNNHNDIVDILIKAGNADVNAANDSLWNSLMIAANEGFFEIAVLLVANGADINAVNYTGKTALVLANEKGHDDIVKLLTPKVPVIKTTAMPAPSIFTNVKALDPSDLIKSYTVTAPVGVKVQFIFDPNATEATVTQV